LSTLPDPEAIAAELGRQENDRRLALEADRQRDCAAGELHVALLREFAAKMSLTGVQPYQVRVGQVWNFARDSARVVRIEINGAPADSFIAWSLPSVPIRERGTAFPASAVWYIDGGGQPFESQTESVSKLRFLSTRFEELRSYRFTTVELEKVGRAVDLEAFLTKTLIKAVSSGMST